MSQESLITLHTRINACRQCVDAGHDIVPGAIFRSGSDRRVMLIGQAPGVTEVEARRPFNAGSGRRLFQWLTAAGWDEADFRERHYMTAVTKCYPGKASSGKGDRVPSRAEQALCRPFLEDEINLVNPRLMILVGGLAIKLLFPKSARLAAVIGTAVYFAPGALRPPLNLNLKQGEWRQSYETRDDDGRWVVPLPHPSGASLWPNKAENKALIERAVDWLALIREAGRF